MPRGWNVGSLFCDRVECAAEHLGPSLRPSSICKPAPSRNAALGLLPLRLGFHSWEHASFSSRSVVVERSAPAKNLRSKSQDFIGVGSAKKDRRVTYVRY